jgi:Secretion system C-terminal sorting domain
MKTFIVSFLLLIGFRPCAAQWQNASADDKAFAFGDHDTSLFASFLDGSTGNYKVLRYAPTAPLIKWPEADGGMNLTGGYVSLFASLGQYFFAGYYGNSGTYKTTNNGATWNGLKADAPIATNGTYLYATDNLTGANPRIRCSHDSGSTWVELDSLPVQSFGCNGACIFASTGYSLWRSLDSGSSGTWTQDTTPVTNIQSFTFLNTIVYALNGSGAVIESTDSGTSWTQISIPRRAITALAASGKYLFAGTDSGVFLSLDFGSNWIAEDSGLGGFLKVSALGVFDTFLFVNASSGSNWYTAYRPISEMVDTAKSIVQMIPPGDTIVVYPNPAMGTVTILAGGTSIFAVSVLNVLGEDVLDVPNVRESEINLDISKLPSGTYFLRVDTEAGNVIRKIVIDR